MYDTSFFTIFWARYNGDGPAADFPRFVRARPRPRSGAGKAREISCMTIAIVSGSKNREKWVYVSGVIPPKNQEGTPLLCLQADL